MAGIRPTVEQQRALALFETGESLAMQAGAGCAKTSTLRIFAEANRDRRMQFTAFNRAIVDDAAAKMPSNVRCCTVHKLAYAAEGHRYEQRKGVRMQGPELARHMRINESLVVRYDGKPKYLAAGWCGSFVLRALTEFCKSADPEPTVDHFPYVEGIDDPVDDGTRVKKGWVNNRAIRRALLPALRFAWEDAQDPEGRLPHYPDRWLKVWERRNPKIKRAALLVDEGQDLSGVMLSIVEQQMDHLQVVLVGDSAQMINGWMGSVDALQHLTTRHQARLTKSFRFGDEIAALANDILDELQAPLRLTGDSSLPSYVGQVERPDAVLCRSNSAAVRRVLEAQKAGTRARLVGGGKEVLDFARGAISLREHGWSPHRDLQCFKTWGEVQHYAEFDEIGKEELALLVRLVDEYTPEVIVSALDRQATVHDAELTVSTAHKSKGLEWGSVRLGDDFKDRERLNDEERRLLYVAATRARFALDVTQCPSFEPVPAAV